MLGELQITHAGLLVGVVVWIERVSGRLSRGDESPRDRMRMLHGADVQRSVLAAQRAGLIARFQLLKDGHDIARRPCATSARMLTPSIEVASGAAHVQHSID